MALENKIENYVFFHLHKTGGTSLRALLDGKEVVSNHCPAVRVKHHYRLHNELAFWGRAFKFAMVRNPYDRMVSLYYHLLNDVSHPYNWVARGMTFEDFVINFEEKAFRNEAVKVLDFYFFDTSWSYVSDPETGELLLDKIYQLERFDAAVEDISERIGVEAFSFKLNRSVLRPKEKSTMDHYSEKTTEIVNRLFAEDFEHFNYQIITPKKKVA